MINWIQKFRVPVQIAGGQMTISLTPELESFVKDQVRVGVYASESDVIFDGLILLKSQNDTIDGRADEIRKKVLAGREQIARGDYQEFSSTEELYTQITQSGRKAYAAKHGQ